MSDVKASEFLQSARGLVAGGANEAVVRKKLEQYLPQIFPDQPWWVRMHAEGAESHTKFEKDGSLRHGFVDTLIGATAVEYEPNLTKLGVDEHAQDQVRDYVAGQVNGNVSIDIIVGVTSDTIRWKAFRPKIVVGNENKRPVGRLDIELEVIDAIDLTIPSPQDGAELKRFLERHLGRVGSRPLRGRMLAADLGLDSMAGSAIRSNLDVIEQAARAARPGYGKLIDRLWSELVDTIGSKGASRSLGLAEYLDEFYLITLAKLICANVIDGGAINRPDADLADILDGAFFSGRGLQNYVEYDLFGWLSESPDKTGMLEVARAIQDDLVAYDFASLITDDLFGQLLAGLGRKSTRLILGQELTPPWLARKMVERVSETLGDAPLRMIDTACGSGTILVEAIRHEASAAAAVNDPVERALRIAASATGFDIDPLAALFAKTNWVIAMRDELPHLAEIAIPIFHADSLFAGLSQQSADQVVLKLDDSSVTPPAALLDANGRSVFDQILSNAYRIAMKEAKGTGKPSTASATSVASSAIALASDTEPFDLGEVTEFVAALITELALLQRDGRNGLWTYVIRNTSRAAQSFAQFNAMVINPPWLALSKIAGNPYATLLDRLAEQLGVRPAGQSFLHTELSAVFLLEGVRRYLEPDGVFGCILPSTIAQGHHHNRFRSGAYSGASRGVAMDVDEIWSIPHGVFKNEAIILFGKKAAYQARTAIAGRSVDEVGYEDRPFEAVTAVYDGRPDRVIWTPKVVGKTKTPGFGFNPAPFRQGADLMPRTAWFHDFQAYGTARSKVMPIRSGDKLWYLLRDAHRETDFRLKAGLIIDDRFLARAVLSNQLSPFAVAPADRLLVPAAFTGSWRELSDIDLATASQGTIDSFDSIMKMMKVDLSGLFATVDLLGKLRRQTWDAASYIVLSGAGGANPCAAWVDPGTYVPGEVVFDQTVYWAPVRSKDEAAYLTGAVNSPACAELIRPFQPRGAQERRHIHKLPFSITPKFDPEDQDHVELAKATLALEAAWQTLLTSAPAMAEKTLPTHSNLQNRRRWATASLRDLTEWARYERAAVNLYGGI